MVNTDLFNVLSNRFIGMSNYDRLFAQKFGGGGKIKELEGVPPITFRSNGTALINYRIYGTAEGAGVRTVNIFTNAGSQNGYLTGTGEIVTPHANLRYTDFLTIPTGATTITFDANFSNSPMNTPAICFYDASKNFISGEIYAQSTPNPRTFTVPNGAFYCRTSYRTAYSDVMLVEGNTAPQTYIPYGYKIPITITNKTEIKGIDIYIRDSKLLSDDYVDYESGKIVRNGTPQDPPLPFPAIETFKGTNTLDVDTIIKPSNVYIKYKS